MIHPQYWSLVSIWNKINRKKYGEALSDSDIKAYLMLNPKDNVILDIGAYTGDSAKLFLDYGARKVICIEKDQERAKKIKLSHTVVYAEEFKPEKHLNLFYDCIKCDIEGYEMLLLPYLSYIRVPIVIEVHNWYIRELFLSAGFEQLTKPSDMLGLCLVGKNLIKHKALNMS